MSERILDTIADGEDVALLLKLYGPSDIPQSEYEDSRYAQARTGALTWIVEQTILGGQNPKLYISGEFVAAMTPHQEGCFVLDPNTGNFIGHDLTFPEAVECAETYATGLTNCN